MLNSQVKDAVLCFVQFSVSHSITEALVKWGGKISIFCLHSLYSFAKYYFKGRICLRYSLRWGQAAGYQPRPQAGE